MVRDLTERDTSKLPDLEFKTTVIKILTGLEKRVDNLGETLNREVENIKKNQSEMKNPITN